MRIETMKGKPCPYKPILCQEGYCQDCQIYLDYQGYLQTMGRPKGIPELLNEADKEIRK